MLYPNARILVFAKPPIRGRCKTRLAGELGAWRAAAIHQQLSQRTFETLASFAEAPVEFHAAYTRGHPWFLQLKRRYGWPLRLQSQGDLGQRMLRAARHTLRKADTCVIVGTDCPVLNTGHLHTALHELQDGQDVVLLPSEDGGYALIGMRVAEPLLFRNLQWGTAAVMRQTRQRLRHSGLRWTELAPVWDVDVPADYRRARRQGLL